MGYRYWGLDTVLRLDTDDICFNRLGSFYTGAGYADSGVITDNNLRLGTPEFFIVSVVIPSGAFASLAYGPTITFNDNQLSYRWSNGSQGRVAFIIYGFR